MFVDRLRELAALGRAIPRQGSSMFVMYGRRRVGKSELLRHFFQNRPHVFYAADLGTSVVQVRTLSRRLGRLWNDGVLLQGQFSDWASLLGYLSERDRSLDLVLDEFPNLCEADPNLPSILQNAWDTTLKKQPFRAVLCGSSVGFMERELLGERSPLFGRRTGQMRLGPMDFWGARGFLPTWGVAAQIEAWACLGGVPAYLEKLDPSLTLEQNLLNKILDPVSFLYEEPRLLLHQELREPRIYFAILAAVAAGNTRLNGIAQEAGLDRTAITRYIDTLIRLELLEREVPATEADPGRSRRGLYRIREPLFRFWFRYVQSNLSDIESGGAEDILHERIMPDLAHFVAPAFERLCGEWMVRRIRSLLSFNPLHWGRWWGSDVEIDLLAYDKQHVLFGECKWSQNPVKRDTLENLISRSARVPGFDGHEKHYALFSKSGFRGKLPSDALAFDLQTLSEDPGHANG